MPDPASTSSAAPALEPSSTNTNAARPCTPVLKRSVTGEGLLVGFRGQNNIKPPTPAAAAAATPSTPSKLGEALQLFRWNSSSSSSTAANPAPGAAGAQQHSGSWLDVATHSYLQKAENHGLYDSLRALRAPKNKISEQIEIDIVRTDLGDSATDDVLSARRASLRNVLHAFSLHDTQIEYVQGMDSVAAAALLHPEGEGNSSSSTTAAANHHDSSVSAACGAAHEERAFWWLVHVTSSILKGFFSRGMPALWTELGVLRSALTTLKPQLLTHLDTLGFDFSLLAPGWYLTLFQRILDESEVAPALLALASATLEPVHIAMAIVLMSEAALLGARDFEEAANALCGTVCASRSRRAPAGVLARAHKALGLLPPRRLRALRAAHAAEPAGADATTAETPRARQVTRRWFESPWGASRRSVR